MTTDPMARYYSVDEEVAYLKSCFPGLVAKDTGAGWEVTRTVPNVRDGGDIAYSTVCFGGDYADVLKRLEDLKDHQPVPDKPRDS